MSIKEKIIASTITGILALSASTMSLAEMASAPGTEKCYGVSKAGANDCAAGVNTCSGSAVKDNQGDAFLFVPNGLCERITGGSLNPITDKTKKSA